MIKMVMQGMQQDAMKKVADAVLLLSPNRIQALLYIQRIYGCNTGSKRSQTTSHAQSCRLRHVYPNGTTVTTCMVLQTRHIPYVLLRPHHQVQAAHLKPLSTRTRSQKQGVYGVPTITMPACTHKHCKYCTSMQNHTVPETLPAWDLVVDMVWACSLGNRQTSHTSNTDACIQVTRVTVEDAVRLNTKQQEEEGE